MTSLQLQEGRHLHQPLTCTCTEPGSRRLLPPPPSHYVWPGTYQHLPRVGDGIQRQPLGELWPQGGPSHTSTPLGRGAASTSRGDHWRGSGTVSLDGGTFTRPRAVTRLAGETSTRQTPRTSAHSFYHSAE